MSAWIRSVTGRAYHFEPLNAKKLERPRCTNRALITPQCLESDVVESCFS